MFTTDEYLAAKKTGQHHAGSKAKESSLRTYANYFRRMEAMIDKPIAKFGKKDVNHLLAMCDEQGLSDSMTNSIVIVGQGIFSWAIGTRQHFEENPFVGIQRRRPEREIKRLFEGDDLERLLAAMDANEADKFKKDADSLIRYATWFRNGASNKFTLMTKLMAYGGLRISEVSSLKKVDLRADGIRVSTESGKGGKARLVPLPEAVQAELVAYVESHPRTDYVFYGEISEKELGKPMSTTPYRRAWAAAIERAGLSKELTPHSLRHTAATRIHEAVGDLAITQSFLGHASPATTMIYVQVAANKVRAASVAAFGK